MTTLISLLLVSMAFASPTTPKAVVETIIDHARHLDNKVAYDENARTIESLVDFDRITAGALGDAANQATPAQRAQIRDLLRQILTKSVYPKAPKFFTDVKLQFTADSREAGQVRISSVVTKGEKRSTVESWLQPESGSYKVVDLAVGGERWVENVHNQFDEIIQKNGIDGLITKMQKRAQKLSQK